MPSQVGGVSLPEPDVRAALRPGAPVAGRDEVARDVDAQHVRTESCRGQRRRAVAGADVEDAHAFRDAELADEASPLSRIVSAIRVKSPFSHNALFGFMSVLPLFDAGKLRGR